MFLLGGLDKLADIVSPIAEDMPVQEVAANKLQRSLKSVQAALETRQAAIFGEEVCFQPLTIVHHLLQLWTLCLHLCNSGLSLLLLHALGVPAMLLQSWLWLNGLLSCCYQQPG